MSFRRALFAAFAILLPATLIPVGADAATTASTPCPTFPETAVIVHPTFAAPRYNFQQPLGSLRQIAETQSAAIFHRDQPVGLALGELTVTMSMQANAVVGGDKMICAKPAALNVEVGFQNSTIYVARELPRRTCAHNEILEHEEGHVAIDRELLKEYLPIIERFLQASVQELGTVKAKDTAAAEDRMQKFIKGQLDKVSEKMNAERARRQAQHDSKEEYQRLAVVCDGDITKAVAQYSPAADREYKRGDLVGTPRTIIDNRPVPRYRDNVTRAPTSRAATQRIWEQQKTKVAPSSKEKAAEFNRQASDAIDQ